jgi:hypothetical protein
MLEVGWSLFERHLPKIHRSSITRVVKKLDNYGPWTTTCMNHSSCVEDQDQIREGEPKPYIG